MERVRIDCTTKCLFSHSFTLGEQHMNQGGHMGNEMIFILANDIRTKFFEFIGMQAFDAHNEIGTIMANATVKYASEGMIGDQITANVYIDHISEITFDFKIQFLKNEEQELAVIRQGIVWYDYKNRKPHELPKQFLDFCDK